MKFLIAFLLESFVISVASGTSTAVTMSVRINDFRLRPRSHRGLEALRISGPNLRIDQPRRPPTFQNANDLLRSERGHVAARLIGDASGVIRRHDIALLEQWVV